MESGISWAKSSYSTFNGNCLEYRKSTYSNYNGGCVEFATSSYSTYANGCLAYGKSSYSGGAGGNCVEFATSSYSVNGGANCVAYGKSSYSFSNSNCVERGTAVLDEAKEENTSPAALAHEKVKQAVADGERLHFLRDSKDPEGPVLTFTDAEWDAFIKGVKDGEFDLA